MEEEQEQIKGAEEEEEEGGSNGSEEEVVPPRQSPRNARVAERVADDEDELSPADEAARAILEQQRMIRYSLEGGDNKDFNAVLNMPLAAGPVPPTVRAGMANPDAMVAPVFLTNPPAAPSDHDHLVPDISTTETNLQRNLRVENSGRWLQPMSILRYLNYKYWLSCEDLPSSREHGKSCPGTQRWLL